MEEKLYLVKSKGFRAYVVATDTNQAWNKFKEWIDGLGVGGDGYGWSWEREFKSVEIVADANARSPKTTEGTAWDDRDKNDKLIL